MPAPISNIPTAQTALNNKANPSPFMSRATASPFLSQQGGSSYGQTGGMSVPTPAGVRATYASQGPAAAVLPSTPVKRTTINNVDGSSTSTEYHAPPTAPIASAAQPATPAQPSPFQVPVNQQMIDAGQPKPEPQPAQPTFGGVVGSLVDTAQNGSQNATQAATGLLNAPSQNAELAQQAKEIGGQYGANISKISNYGNALAGSYTNGAGLAPVSQGLAGQAQQTTAAEVAGQQAAENAALAPINQELTAQSQGQAGLTSAGSIANTQQQNEQSGLQQAGSLAQPNATSQGQTVFNPLTGKFEGGSYQNNLATVIQSIKNGDIGYTAGVDSISGLSPTAKADVLAGLGTGFDTVSSDAKAATKGSNIQTGGTATTGANAQGLAQSIQQETTLNTAANNATALATQLQTALQSSGLNLTNSTDANTAINNLQSRLGNAAYTQLNIAVNDARNAYGAILQATGATPTDADAKANQNINANMSPKQILAAIDQLSQGVNARQQSQHQQTQQYQSQLKGSGETGNSTGNNGGGSYTSSSGATYTLPY